MAQFTFTNNTYAGEALAGFMASTLLEADSVKRGLLTVINDVKSRKVILDVDDDVVLQGQAHYHQKSVIQNNVLKTDQSKLSTVRKTDIQRDSTYKHIADQRDSSVISNLKSTIGWIIILLMIGTIVFFLVKKQLLKL